MCPPVVGPSVGDTVPNGYPTTWNNLKVRVHSNKPVNFTLPIVNSFHKLFVFKELPRTGTLSVFVAAFFGILYEEGTMQFSVFEGGCVFRSLVFGAEYVYAHKISIDPEILSPQEAVVVLTEYPVADSVPIALYSSYVLLFPGFVSSDVDYEM